VPVDAVHVTPDVPTSLATVALRFKACPSVSPPRFGVTVTLIWPVTTAVIVIVVAAVFVGSVTEVAVNVTVGVAGMLAGAMYVTAAPEALDVGVTVPHAAPVQTAPASDQVTPLPAASFATVAVNACVAPTWTLAVVSKSVTLTAVEAPVTMIVAVPFLDPSATDVAVSVTIAGLGTLAGAV
jgi:hypothetical protein